MMTTVFTTKLLAVIMSIYEQDSQEKASSSIQSILKQSFQDFDFFIQLDGPIKQSVESYLNSLTDSRIHIFRREKNLGLAQSLNDLLGIVLSHRYNYIARMDADDICFPERLETQIHYLEEHPEIECLGTWAIEITNAGEEFFRKQMPESHEECLKLFKKRDCMIHPTVMFRRSYFEKAGLYSTDTYFAEDTMMWAQGFAAGCHFANVPEYLYYFRIDDNFFERRRGWKHAKNIFLLRCKVNRMLHFGIGSYIYAFAYAFTKLLPKPLLDLVYRIAR